MRMKAPSPVNVNEDDLFVCFTVSLEVKCLGPSRMRIHSICNRLYEEISNSEGFGARSPFHGYSAGPLVRDVERTAILQCQESAIARTAIPRIMERRPDDDRDGTRQIKKALFKTCTREGARRSDLGAPWDCLAVRIFDVHKDPHVGIGPFNPRDHSGNRHGSGGVEFARHAVMRKHRRGSENGKEYGEKSFQNETLISFADFPRTYHAHRIVCRPEVSADGRPPSVIRHVRARPAG